MPPPHTLADLAAEDFVLLTTFRRDGRPVATPVWVAGFGDALVVSTPEGTGKVKRLRHTPRVTLQACSRRGHPKPGAPVVEAVAVVRRDEPTRAAVEAALLAKYGWQWRIAMVVERIVRRGRPVPRPTIRVTSSRPDGSVD